MPQSPILQTKLYIPPIQPKLVSRPRLIEQLNEGLYRKLTLISAPAGFGKTTLLSEWIAGSEPRTRVAWLSLDEGDNDTVRFLTYFVATLQTVEPGIGDTALAVLQSPQPPPIEPVLTVLINEIAGRTDDLILVLDDYHLIDAQPVHKAMAFLLDHQPPNMHLVITSRADPPLPLSRLRGRGQLTELRPSDLRFAHDEAAAFLNQVMGLGLSAEDVTALEARTEGWIVGLQMAALSMRGRDAERIAGFIAGLTGGHRYILDYLTDEVLMQQPEQIRAFLLQTSVLNRLTGPLCDAVTGQGNGQQILQQLDSANLFVVPLDDERRWYRYHHLFADFLRTGLDRESQAALHLKAAHWFATQDLLLEGVEHALASGDKNEAARVIALAAEGALRTASFVTLLGWLNALPDEMVRTSFELATYKGILLYLTRHYGEAAEYADAAEHNLPPDAPLASRGQQLSLRAMLAVSSDAPDSAVQLAKQALHCLGEGDAFFRSLMLNTLGQISYWRGDTTAAADAYRDAVLIERQTGGQPGAMQLVNLAFALNELGQRREALSLCEQVIEESGSLPDRPSPLAEVICLALSVLSFEANELDLAHERVRRGLDICQQMQFTDGVFLSHFFLAQVRLASGEIDAMRKTAHEARQYATRLNLSLPYEPWLAALEAQACLHQGDLAAATRWAEAAQLTPADNPPPFLELVYSVYVRLLLAQNRLEDARILLATMEHAAKEGGRRRRLITISLQQALVQRASGHKEQALATVETALRLAVPEGYRRAFLDEGPAIVDLLPRLRHIAPDFVDHVLGDASAAGLEPVIPRAQALVEPLSERELQVLRLLAAGLTSTEVARELYIAVGTARTHIKNIYGKLGVHSRVEAVTRAQELGLV
ncbi:MAG TPA: LuxR C-terminal-related transcriptional regulator [Anaerolineae bacterium]|nr:LuxR C-terminal-related transcriptional regulator [Anaerolineae bacterium]